MKIAHRIEIVLAVILSLLVIPFLVSAHERQVFEINGEQYLFVVGSLGEPIVVDDRTGTDLRVYKADPNDIGNSSAEGAVPIEGLQEDLKIIMSADGESREMDISAVWGTVGQYKTLFYPTKATEFSYTIVGELNGVDIELPFTCNAGGHVMSHGGDHAFKPEEVHEGVTRVFQAGSFGCPQEKAPLGFPVNSASVADTQGILSSLFGLIEQLLQRLN